MSARNRLPTHMQLVLLLSVMLPAAAVGQAVAPRWQVNEVPLLAVGVVDGTEAEELAAVTGVRRLPGGQLVVANGKPREVRVFSAKGKLLHRLGRTGEGPGEYRGELNLLHAGGDSILVFDQGRMRTMLFGLNGKLIKEFAPQTGGQILSQSALYHRAFIRGTGVSLNGCARPVLDKLPEASSQTLYDVVVDQYGRSWVRQLGGSQWVVYGADAKAIGTVTLPPNFALMQVGPDFVAGVGRLADDIEQAVVLKVAQPATGPRPACLDTQDAFAPPSNQRVAQVKMAMRNAVMAGEAMQKRHGHYVSSADSLGVQLPSGVSLRVLKATANGWAFALFDSKSAVTCVMGMGDATPTGWVDGLLRCGG